MPEIDAEHRIFPPCGKDKKEYIPDGVKPTDYLLDDYTNNLALWQPPAKGIKILNGINDTNGIWKYDKLDFRKSGEEMANNINSIMNEGAFIRDKIENPDTNISLTEMYEYGYTWKEMLPLTKQKALELFERDYPVYLLHNDGTESAVEDIKQITEHKGIFGIEQSDWKRSKERKPEQVIQKSENEEKSNRYDFNDIKNLVQTKSFNKNDFNTKDKATDISKDNNDLCI